MKRILVGVDDSEHAKATLQWATDLAARTNAEVVAARVFVPSQAELDRRLDEELHDVQLRELNTWCDALPEGTPRPDTVLLDGQPAEQLLDAVDEQSADLLVIGGRGAGGFSHLHLGSVAHHLIHNTTFPLAVVPHDGAAPVTRLVLGADGSPGSSAAIEFCARLAGDLGVGVTAVHAYEPFLEWVPTNDPGSWHRRAEAELCDWVTPITRAHVDVDIVVDRDIHPVAALSRALSETPGALAVVGTHGLGGFSGMRLGRVPLQLLHHTGSPVLVVPAVE